MEDKNATIETLNIFSLVPGEFYRTKRYLHPTTESTIEEGTVLQFLDCYAYQHFVIYKFVLEDRIIELPFGGNSQTWEHEGSPPFEKI